MNPIITAQNLVGCLTHDGIHVNGINSFYIWVFIHHPADGPEHILHRLTQIFPAMGGNQDQTAALGPIQFWMRIIFPDSGLQSVDSGIASDINGFQLFAFLQQILLGKLRWGKIVLADDADCLPVKFLG